MDQVIEAQLNQWRDRLTTISRNVMELSQSPSTQRIAARAKKVYAGVTAERAAEALKCIDDLWLDYLLLLRVVDDAAELAGRSTLFRKNDDQVLALLDGPSVELPAVHVPLPARELLTGSSHSEHTTLAKMLEVMQEVFGRAMDTLCGIADAEQHLGQRMAGLAQRSAELARRARALGEGAAALAVREQSLEQVERDPLGCAQEAARVETELDRREALLERIVTERRQTAEGLGLGKTRLAELRALIVGSRGAMEEARLKIAAASGFVEPLDETSLAPLEDWLRTLESVAAEGRWSAVAVGLRRWSVVCEARLETARACMAANSKLLEERADLQGRFKAYGAKLLSLQTRGAPPPPGLEKLMAETRAALDARPCDLAAARTLVLAFEDRFARRRA